MKIKATKFEVRDLRSVVRSHQTKGTVMNPMQSPNVGPGGKDFGKRDEPPRREPRDEKIDFDEALQRLNEDRYVTRDHVLARALKRKVWVAELLYKA